MKEEKQFQTESKQLLDLMINSIYSDKEIFLREIISNASDAIDKYKFISASDSTLPAKDHHIRINVNKDERYIEVEDTGIGMNKDEIETNLGTIAKSGSKEFLQKFKEAKDKEDLDIIGQFGVGFYSSFMVGKKVEVRTRKHGDQAYLFTSDGVESYSVEDITMDDLDSGSRVRVYLKDDTDDINYSSYLEDYKIEELVKKYSDYIRYPILHLEEKTVNDKDADGKDIEGKTHKETEDKTLNSMIPLWKMKKSDVTEEKLNEFYKSRFHDYEDPLLSLNLKVEGMLSYAALIYIPSHAPYNLYSENYEKGLALYSKGIFIEEKCKELVPDYLKFISGLVDSEDFSLNISRETLQKSPILGKISTNIENKVIDKLKEIKKDDYEKYLKFFKVYGDYIKFGIYSSYGMKKDQLQDLLIFDSLTEEKQISLKDYEDKMKEGQKAIYYAAGKTLDEIKMLPQLEKYRHDGINVLFFPNSIDEFTIMSMQDYDKHEFKNIATESKEELNEEEKKKIDDLTVTYKRVLDDIKEGIKDKVDEVSFSSKLVDSPVCITTKNGLSLNMEHVLDSNPEAKNMDENEKPKAIKVLEINPDHDLFKAISQLTDEDDLKKYGSLLYSEAIMLEGYEIEDKKKFVSDLNELMMKAMKR